MGCIEEVSMKSKFWGVRSVFIITLEVFTSTTNGGGKLHYYPFSCAISHNSNLNKKGKTLLLTAQEEFLNKKIKKNLHRKGFYNSSSLLHAQVFIYLFQLYPLWPWMISQKILRHYKSKRDHRRLKIAAKTTKTAGETSTGGLINHR